MTSICKKELMRLSTDDQSSIPLERTFKTFCYVADLTFNISSRLDNSLHKC